MFFRAAFDSVWAHIFQLEPEDVALGERTRRIVVTTIWFATSLALAVIVPDISAVIAVLGGLAALFIFEFPGKFELIGPWEIWMKFFIRYVIFKRIDGRGISCEIALIWMSLDFTDDQSTLVKVMAWCRQATSHYLSQCWPNSLSPYDVTRPQWVNTVHAEFIKEILTCCILYQLSLHRWYS